MNGGVAQRIKIATGVVYFPVDGTALATLRILEYTETHLHSVFSLILWTDSFRVFVYEVLLDHDDLIKSKLLYCVTDNYVSLCSRSSK